MNGGPRKGRPIRGLQPGEGEPRVNHNEVKSLSLSLLSTCLSYAAWHSTTKHKAQIALLVSLWLSGLSTPFAFSSFSAALIWSSCKPWAFKWAKTLGTFYWKGYLLDENAWFWVHGLNDATSWCYQKQWLRQMAKGWLGICWSGSRNHKPLSFFLILYFNSPIFRRGKHPWSIRQMTRGPGVTSIKLSKAPQHTRLHQISGIIPPAKIPRISWGHSQRAWHVHNMTSMVTTYNILQRQNRKGGLLYAAATQHKVQRLMGIAISSSMSFLFWSSQSSICSTLQAGPNKLASPKKRKEDPPKPV